MNNGHEHVNGYRRMYYPNTPISTANNNVYVHRVVLYETIGYGPHQCHRCKCHINWGSGLQADHQDGNRANNVISNLKPSCRWCNLATRHYQSKAA